MPETHNRKRTKKRTEEETSLWGFLFSKNVHNQDITKSAFFGQAEEDTLLDDEVEAPSDILHKIWRHFNLLSTLATLIFLIFTYILFKAATDIWTPQNLRDIAGYSDNGSARDLAAQLKNANGQEISFTEAEINRFLRETCRLRQTGVFSIITHGHGVGLRIHNGYAELVIDRMIGANIHQTTSVNLTFDQETEHGRPILKILLQGGEPLTGGVPCGGTIGTFKLPSRHISMLTPALHTLLDCYPEIVETIEQYGYCPYFSKGQNGNESRVRLIPYKPS